MKKGAPHHSGVWGSFFVRMAWGKVRLRAVFFIPPQLRHRRTECSVRWRAAG